MKSRIDRALAELVSLLKSSKEWRDFFRECCQTGALRLRSQARQFRAELREGGRGNLALVDVEDSLLVIARKVLPGTPGATWEPEFGAELCADALARIEERCVGTPVSELEVLNFSPLDPFAEKMNAAAAANDPAGFRAALREWERAALEALEASESARRGAA